MPTLSRPGVYVQNVVSPSFVTNIPGNAVAAFVGPINQGPTVPTVVNGWTQFQQLYGPVQPGQTPNSVALAALCYLACGGSSFVVSRAISSTSPPTAAQTSLSDSASSPNPTLTVSASNPGTWGNNLYVAVTQGTQSVGGVVQTFNLVVYLNGTAAGNVVETWNNLTMTQNPGVGYGSYAPALVNGNSNYITLTAIADVDSAPLNNPAVQSAVNLTGGTNGGSPSISDNLVAIEALDIFPNQAFLINLPGISDATDIGNAVGYAEGRGDSFVVIDVPQGLSASSAAAFAQSLGAASFGAVYGPWLAINDPYSTNVNITRLVPPGGAVCGAITNVDATAGVQQSPAGTTVTLPIVSALEQNYTLAEQGTLNLANFNAIITAPNVNGAFIWGARTLSTSSNLIYIAQQRTLNYIQQNLVNLASFAVFQPNDYVTWTSVSSVLSSWLTSFWNSGGLNGQAANQAFYVTCDETNNTTTTIAEGQLNIQVGVALLTPAEFVIINISQSQNGTTVNNSLSSTASSTSSS